MSRLTLSSFSQNATVTVTPTSVILTWRCIWLRGTSVEVCVTTVSTTPWAATVRPVNLFTIRIQLETSETRQHVSVSCSFPWVFFVHGFLLPVVHVVFCVCVQLVTVTRWDLWREEFVTVILIWIWVWLVVSVAVSRTSGVSAVTTAKKDTMDSVLTTH